MTRGRLGAGRPSSHAAPADQHLGKLGIVKELTNRKRGRVFSYRRYVQVLSGEVG